MGARDQWTFPRHPVGSGRCRLYSIGLGVEDLGFRTWGLGLWAYDLSFRIWRRMLRCRLEVLG